VKAAPLSSALIADIQKLVETHGDLPICIDDPDTGWMLIPSVSVKDGYIQISSGYNERVGDED
jgi:hypothetical protein